MPYHDILISYQPGQPAECGYQWVAIVNGESIARGVAPCAAAACGRACDALQACPEVVGA